MIILVGLFKRIAKDPQLKINAEKFKSSQSVYDAAATITLETYQPNLLKYSVNNQNAGFAVFSEIYYENGWNAYIDDVLTPHYNVNYVLRGMVIPKGIHKIEFKFEPNIIKQGEIISLISYALLLLIPIGFISYNKKNRNKDESGFDINRWVWNRKKNHF